MFKTIFTFMIALGVSFGAFAQEEPLACGGPAVSFEAGLMPSDWSITTLANAGGEFIVSADNSSAFWNPGPTTDGTFYASANDDLDSSSDGSADYLYSNVFDLTGMNLAYLTFDYHFNADFSHMAGGVEVSGDGGGTWDGEIVVPAGAAWQTYVLDLSAYANNPTVKVRFHSDDQGFWATGYAVDNLRLTCDVRVVPPATAVPTLPEWAMILLSLLLVMVAYSGMRRKQT